jgi:hypothetical protein
MGGLQFRQGYGLRAYDAADGLLREINNLKEFKRQGYVKVPDDRIEKDPDARIRATIDLIFRKFAELGSVRQVYFWLDQQQMQLPVARGPEEAREIVWQPARYHAVLSVLKNPLYAEAYAYGRSKTITRLEAGQKRVLRQVQHRR